VSTLRGTAHDIKEGVSRIIELKLQAVRKKDVPFNHLKDIKISMWQEY
jgi:hypothetical protein